MLNYVKKNNLLKTFEEMLKEAGSVKKEGVTVIKKNGKVYVFNYSKRKKK